MSELQLWNSGSITGLFTHLCELYTPEVKRSHLTQPKLDRKDVKTRLKRKLYNTLFAYLKLADRWVKLFLVDILKCHLLLQYICEYVCDKWTVVIVGHIYFFSYLV